VKNFLTKLNIAKLEKVSK